MVVIWQKGFGVHIWPKIDPLPEGVRFQDGEKSTMQVYGSKRKKGCSNIGPLTVDVVDP